MSMLTNAHSSKRLLIVEDDPEVGHMLGEILRPEGFDCTIVTEGLRALDTLRGSRFDLVLLDVMLPGQDGIAIMREIRDDPANSSIPVVMLTARSDDETTWEGWKAGCDSFLPKPFDPDELLAIIGRLGQTVSADGREAP